MRVRTAHDFYVKMKQCEQLIGTCDERQCKVEGLWVI